MTPVDGAGSGKVFGPRKFLSELEQVDVKIPIYRGFDIGLGDSEVHVEVVSVLVG